MKRYLLFSLFFLLTVAAFAGGIPSDSPFGIGNTGGGGVSFNPAAPGAIGGTTSSTGQFTKLAVGPSVPTLPANNGDAYFTGAGTFYETTGDRGSNLYLEYSAANGMSQEIWRTTLGGNGWAVNAQNTGNGSGTVFSVNNVNDGSGGFSTYDTSDTHRENATEFVGAYGTSPAGVTINFARVPACTAFLDGTNIWITDGLIGTLGAAVTVGGGSIPEELTCFGGTTTWRITRAAPTAAGAITSTMWSGTSATIASSGTDYIAFGENPGVSVIGTQANAQNIAPFAGTASHLYCFGTTAAQAGGVVYTVYDGASAQTLTCTMNAGATLACNDTTHSFAVAAGDLLSVKVVNSNAANATGVTGCGFAING